MSTELSEFQMLPANGSTFANGESSRSRRASYQSLAQDANLFWDTLSDFHESSSITVTNPIVIMGGTSIKLHQLFVEVTSRGGLDKVIKDRKCCEVMRVFNPTISNVAVLLKKHYGKMLLEFEKMYYFQDPAPGLNINANHHVFTMDGVITSKFDHGYFITMKMGSEELKGVLYHPTPTDPVETLAEARRNLKR